MPQDQNLYFTAATGDDLHVATTKGSLSIPLGAARNIGIGSHKLYIEAIVKVALTTGGKTQEIDLIAADDAALTVNVVTIKASILSFAALAPIGNRQIAHIPEAQLSAASGAFLKESAFLGIVSQSASGDPGAGSYVALLTLEPGLTTKYATTSLVDYP